MTPKRRLATLTLISAGFISAVVVMLLFIGLFFSSTHQLTDIAKQLYIHPFAVSNAASELRTTLYQMRSRALVVVLMKQQGNEWAESASAIDAYEKKTFEHLAVIKANFLGDMAKVDELERKIRDWHIVRSNIMHDVRMGRFGAAEAYVRSNGTPLFEEIIGLADYVLTYAKGRAKRFVDEGSTASTHLIKQGIALAVALIAAFVGLAVIVFWRIRFLQFELVRLADTDALTGLCNRRRFFEAIDDEIARSARYGLNFSLAIVDLDFFKKINDTYGHNAGDSVLKAFCTLCGKSLRESDLVGRLGGEEFGILMPNTSSASALEALTRLRREIEQTCVEAGAHTIRFTASFGVSDYLPGCKADQLVALADAGLYQAKARGRNRVTHHAAPPLAGELSAVPC